MAALELELSAVEKYTIPELKELCKERGLTLRSGAKKAEYQKALRAFEEAHRIRATSQDEDEGEEEGDNEEEDDDLAADLGLGEGPAGIRSAAPSEVGSSVSSTNLTPAKLEDRRVERALKLQLTKLRLAAKERKATAKKRNEAADEKKV